MRVGLIVVAAVLMAGCAMGVNPDPIPRTDAARDLARSDTLVGREDSSSDAGPVDASPVDVPLRDTGPRDAAVDALVIRDVPVAPPGCDAVPGGVDRGSWSPTMPVAPQRLTFSLDGPNPWTNLEVRMVRSDGLTVSPTWIGVTGSYRWQWFVDPTHPGDYCVTVRTDPSGTLRWRGPLRIAAAMGGDAGATCPPGTSPTWTCTSDGRARTRCVSGVTETQACASGCTAGSAGTAAVCSSPPAGGFVSRVGNEFMAGGSRLRFVGMNLRGLPHYGTPRLMYARVEQIDQELEEVRRMGARVVRVFAASEDADHATVAARLQRVLDGAASRGLYVIVALTDFYADTGLNPRGDRDYYAPTSGYNVLNADFFRSGFRTNYLPWVRTVVTRFASHPAVFAWELGNEVLCNADHRAFIEFARETGGVIRSLAPRHLITTGMITGRWMTDTEARELYRLPVIDFITYHNYEGTHEHADFDYAVARDTGLPLVDEEGGFSADDRAAQTDTDIRWHIDSRGARGYMQWGFTIITPDNGNGDRIFGMDRLGHAGDYDRLFAMYQSSATRIR